MDKKFYNKIIKLIPSDTLKAFLNESKFRFEEKDLLAIINKYSRNYNEKIALLEEAVFRLADKSAVFHAKKLIDMHKSIYDGFMQPNQDCVYDITIIESDNSPDERRFITKTFEDAKILIKNYKKRYSDGYYTNSKSGALIDGKYVYYKIYKSTTIVPQKPSDIHSKVGQIGECLLGKRLEILDVDFYNYGITDMYGCKNKDCEEDCKSQCIIMHQYYIKFPAFLEQYQLVAFKEWDKIYYGILPYKMKDGDDDSYVIDLDDNGFISNRENLEGLDDYRIFDAHQHPSYFDIYVPKRQDVPNNIYENYLYAVEILKELDYNSDGCENIRRYIIK